LGDVGAVACESAASARRLLSALGLPCPRLIVHREEGREQSAAVVLEVLHSGSCVALVSDSGTPGISDPGRSLVDLCHACGVPVRVVPGPSSVIAAVSACGLPARRWAFEGFLPAKGSERRERLVSLSAESRTLVLLEAPHRLQETLRDLLEALGDREAFLGRELTKKFEETRRGTLSSLLEVEPRGECVLVVGPGTAGPSAEELPVEAMADWLSAQELSARQVAEFLSRFGGMKRNEAYQLALSRQDRTDI